MDQVTDFLSELPIGLIIFIIALAFGMFSRDDKKEQPAPPERRQAPPSEPMPPSVFASDDRRAREERAMRQRQEQEPGEVLVFGGMEFGRRGSLFEEDDRESQWGKTKYGFDESEWGSAFGEKKSSDPIIR